MKIRVGLLAAWSLAGALAPALRAQAFRQDWLLDTGYPVTRATLDPSDHILIATSGNYLDFYASKVDPQGNLLWTVSEGSPSFVDQARWVAADSQGNVILTGHRNGGAGGLMTVKWDPNGVLQWVDVVNLPSGEAYRVEVDANDDIYVAGKWFNATSGGYDFHAVKYDAQGAILWQRSKDFGTGSDNPRAMALAPDGRMAITGDAGLDIATVVYDKNGKELFADVHLGLGGGEDVAVGADGSVSVCGTGIWTIVAGTVIRYAPDGTKAWVAEYNGPNGGWDRFRRMTLDTRGNVLAVGQSQGRRGYQDWSVVQVDPQGVVQWARHHSGFEQMDEWALWVATGPDDSVYVAGKAGPSPCGAGMERKLIKYAPDGTEEWLLGGDCAGLPTSLALDSTGELIVDGGFADTLYRFLLADWRTLGQALAGSAGLPDLTVTGFLDPGGTVRIDLANALPNTRGWYVLGTDRLDLPFAGGVMVPTPDRFVPLRTDGAGAHGLAGTLPPALAGPLQVFLQAWLLDPGAVQGLAASDAVMKSIL